MIREKKINKRLEERLFIFLGVITVSLFTFTSTVLSQQEELTNICGGGTGDLISSIIAPIIELFILFLIMYGFAAFGWAKMMGKGGHGEAEPIEKAKWGVGTVVLIYVGYLIAYQIVQIDLSCLLPLV